MRDRS
jgi:CRP-like cAMP-binding protein